MSDPRIREAIMRARASLVRIGGDGLSSVLSRPRFLRGASLEHVVEARTITTQRLELRRHHIGDVDRWYELVSDSRVIRHLSWPMRDYKAARRHLRDRTRHTRLWQVDDFLALAVVKDGRTIGDVSLQLRTVTSDVRSVEVGWVLSPDHQGHGYATEAVSAILELAFGAVHARMVTAVIDVGNEASVALAKRLGFTVLHRGPSNYLMVITPELLRASTAKD